MRLGEPVTEGGREFHRVTACGAKEHIKYVVFELYGSSWRGLVSCMNRRVPVHKYSRRKVDVLI